MEPKIAQKAPYVVELEEGKAYHWCACGQSKISLFAMVLIMEQSLSLWHSMLKKLVKPIYADANNQRTRHFVMAHTEVCN